MRPSPAVGHYASDHAEEPGALSVAQSLWHAGAAVEALARWNVDPPYLRRGEISTSQGAWLSTDSATLPSSIRGTPRRLRDPTTTRSARFF